MPELPEVETTVRGLSHVLKGRRIVRIKARRADLRRSFPKDLGQRLTGAKVIGLGRRAKYGLIHTDRDDTMVFHLGMSGSWRINHSNLEKHDHLLLETDDGNRLALNDPRRFGSVDLVQTDELSKWPAFKAMGPEPLDITPEDYSAMMIRSALNAGVVLPPQALRASAPPTLTLRTPSAATAATVKSLAEPIRRFTGFGATAATTAVISSRVRMPGA